MSELWRMERKRDKNAREMKVPGPGTRPGPGGGAGPSDALPSAPTQHQPNSRSAGRSAGPPRGGRPPHDPLPRHFLALPRCPGPPPKL